MAVSDIRRAHLEAAIQEAGGINALAQRLGIPPQNIYALRSGQRNIGNTRERRLEKAMKWPSGSVDLPMTGDDAELLRLLNTLSEEHVIEALRSVISELSPDGVSRVSAAILERVAQK